MMGVSILIATPGRLIELAESNAVHLSAVKSVVLDEADKLSDMIAFIRNGKISLQGTPEQLKSQTNNLHRITVSTKDLDLAEKVLSENKIEFKKVSDTFEIQDSILQTALKQLINANIVILEINPVKQSLEDVFLNATKGEQQNENN
ncbi:DEAD/DEAH box helicase [Lactobacillus acetotolerans]|uniref:DEAD/DEAH box helicase n=1 Tax=Lactobacillus acetotolerans TaxID=1600 RepID=UPI002FDB9328